MTDLALGPGEGETPVNPYSLLEAVNHSSDTAHTAWLIFLAIMAYFVIAVAGVTHRDLLLETPVALPILQVNIQLTQFFQFAPVILVLFHLGLVSQLTLLARETLEFDHAVRLLETSDRRTHPLRLELNNFFFVQAISGPHRSRVMSAFLHTISWLTLVILPVILLLYIQVVFLPYHNVVITWMHRAALLADVAMLVAMGVFLLRAETSFVQAFLRTTASHPVSFVSTIIALLVLTLFSLSFATIPGEWLDRTTQRVIGIDNEDETGTAPRFAKGFAIPVLAFGSEGSLLGIFQRNLVVTDADLVSDKDVSPGEPSVSLRDRDLRFAKLDRSDLHQADFTGSDLRGASLVGTDLRGAWFQCADLTELLLTENRTAARCTTARRANLTRARLEGAHMGGADLRNARLEEAKLEAVELPYALIAGADFSSAKLDKADLTGGVAAQGASFLIASLQGADLSGAQLLGADFSAATLQGALLNYANLTAANFTDADLEAASFIEARIEGANFSGAKIGATDFRGAKIWMTKPPEADPSGVADFTGAVVEKPGEDAVAALKASLESIRSRRVRAAVSEKVAPVLSEAASEWATSDDATRWQGYAAPPATPPITDPKYLLTEHVTKLMCKARWSGGSIATGIARQAQTQQFRGNLVAVFDRLKSDDCAAGKAVPVKIMRDLGAAADIARGG